VKTLLNEKPEIHKKQNDSISPYKAELVKMFYGNDFQRVITYHWVYERPEEEKLKKWHEAIMADKTIQNMKRL
jgi:hypothetical protein